MLPHRGNTPNSKRNRFPRLPPVWNVRGFLIPSLKLPSSVGKQQNPRLSSIVCWITGRNPKRGLRGLNRRCALHRLLQIKQPTQLLSSRWFLAGDVSGKLVLIEDLPNARQESRQFPGKLRVMFRLLGKRDQLLTDEVVE